MQKKLHPCVQCDVHVVYLLRDMRIYKIHIGFHGARFSRCVTSAMSSIHHEKQMFTKATHLIPYTCRFVWFKHDSVPVQACMSRPHTPQYRPACHALTLLSTGLHVTPSYSSVQACMSCPHTVITLLVQAQCATSAQAVVLH